MKELIDVLGLKWAILAIALLGFGGWVANIVKLFSMFGGDISALFIGRLVGIFAAPLGAVLGFM
jgi:hypothetical protein